MSEAGWTIRHQTWNNDFGGDLQFWYLWLTYNGIDFGILDFYFLGKRVDFEADADDIYTWDGTIWNSAKKLTPDSSGMVKLKGEREYVRWNIKILK